MNNEILVKKVCEICGKEFNNINGLSKHIVKSHDITKEEYYLKYIGDNNCWKCKTCGNKTAFKNMGKGFNLYCDLNCYNNDENILKYRKEINVGRKQSEDTINKRVSKINYSDVIEKRKDTMIDKFGVDNYSKLDSQRKKKSDEYTGRKNPRVDSEHQFKIIQSKINNNTIKHTDSAKQSISRGLLKYYENEDNSIKLRNPITSPYKGVRTGYLNGLYYRSSYEKYFIEMCFKNGVNVESAENKKFMCFYINENNKKKRYYPDFYLTDLDIVIEIKAKWTVKSNITKLKSGVDKFKYFLLLTQDELFSENFEFIFMQLIDDVALIYDFTDSIISKSI